MEESSPVPQSVWQRLADPALKRTFAAYLVVKADSPQGRFEAAKLTLPGEPDNSFLIYQIMEQWPADPLVIAERDKLSKEVPADELPTVEQTAREVYNLAIDNSKSIKERLDAYRLYGELRQMIGKGGGNVQVNVHNDNRGVFVIPQRAIDNDAFQQKAIEQQARLISGVKSPTN